MKTSETLSGTASIQRALAELEQAKQVHAHRTLKLAKEVIKATNGELLNSSIFFTALYGEREIDVDSDTHANYLRLRNAAREIDRTFGEEAILVRGYQGVKDFIPMTMGKVGSFSDNHHAPYRFRLSPTTSDTPWNETQVIEGTLEAAVHEIESPLWFAEHKAREYGFTKEAFAVQVGGIKTYYSDKGLYHEEQVGNVYIGIDEILKVCGSLGQAAIHQVTDYYRAGGQFDR